MGESAVLVPPPVSLGLSLSHSLTAECGSAAASPLSYTAPLLPVTTRIALSFSEHT